MAVTEQIAEKVVVHTAVTPALHPDSTAPWGQPSRDAKNNVVPAPLVTPDGRDLPALTAGKVALTALYHGLNDCETAVATAKAQYGVSPNAGKTAGQPMPPVLSEERSNALAGDLGVKFSKVAKIVDQQIGVLSDTITALDQQVATALKSPHKDALSASEASDIRRLVKDMASPAERISWLSARIDAGDFAEVAACIASPWAAGLDKAYQARLLDLAASKFASIPYKQAAAVRSLHSHVSAGAQRFTNRFRQIAPVPTAPSPAAAAAAKLRE